MSEKDQQHLGTSGTGVSRETTGRTEAEEAEGPKQVTPEQQMLFDIMDRSMTKHQAGAPAETNGAPTETQRSGFGGERRDSGADELSPQAEASEQSSSRRVSRETIVPQEKAPPPPRKNSPSSVYVYLAVLFGAAFLMLLLAYFVQQRNNDAVQDDLELLTASRQELMEEIEALKKENESLTKENGRLNDWADQKSEEAKQLNDILDQTYYQTNDLTIEKQALYYLWYLQQFMDQGDYTLAAAEIVFSTAPWRDAWENQISLNPALLERYDAARQELIRRGYLQQLDHPRDGGTDIYFTSRWNPNENNDMAALSILWCALDAHFVTETDNAASQYLYRYPLGDPASGYQERVERLASKFTLEQFQLMKDKLVESKWLVIAEDGAMSEGFGPTGFRDDVLYNLPFELPFEPLAKIPLN